jgi:hypothetical protein
MNLKESQMTKAILAATALTLFVNTAKADIFQCRGNDSESGDYTLLLENHGRMSIDDVPEGTLVPFLLILKNDGNTILKTTVLAQQEDVLFGFEAASGKVAGHIYLDELDQSSLSVDSLDHGLNFECERTE